MYDPYTPPEAAIGDLDKRREKYRPASTIVLGILNVLFGILGLILRLAGFGGGNRGQVQADLKPIVEIMNGHPVVRSWLSILHFLAFFVWVVMILSGVGLLLMRSWGRIFALLYGVYGIYSACASLLIYALLRLRTVAKACKQRRRRSNSGDGDDFFDVDGRRLGLDADLSAGRDDPFDAPGSNTHISRLGVAMNPSTFPAEPDSRIEPPVSNEPAEAPKRSLSRSVKHPRGDRLTAIHAINEEAKAHLEVEQKPRWKLSERTRSRSARRRQSSLSWERRFCIGRFKHGDIPWSRGPSISVKQTRPRSKKGRVWLPRRLGRLPS